LLLLTATLVACEGGTDPHAGHDDHGPPGASGDRVELSPAQVKAAGIQVRAVGPGTVTQRLRLTAVVRENLDTQAHLTPKVPGLVRSVRKGLGDTVQEGEILCELESTVLGEATSVYMEVRATLDAAERSLVQETALLTSSVHVAQRIFKRESRLKDQAITTLRPFYEAEKALATARLSRDSRVLELKRQVTQREIQLHTAEERLRILGLSSDDLRKLEADEEHGHGRYPLRAPRSGVIVARDITENEYVETSSKLFLIQDLTRVWVMASVYERDLSKVERGQKALVRLTAFPGVTLEGKVTFLDYRLDPASRACQIRIELPNEGIPGWKEPFPLRPGLFGNVELVLAKRQAAVVIPERAIVHEGEASFVFVEVEDDHDSKSGSDHDDHDDHDSKGAKSAAGHDEHEGHDHGSEGSKSEAAHDGVDEGRVFKRRAVVLGAHGHDGVEVTKGLAPGERVVIEGTFTLKSAARQGELGGGHSH
tara:strand:+ start:220 stop:1662 length:1443 start_codon:yes stop_codon:yes gene_type:complete